jgi:quaternary ammonium compound-resistance protein SugE
MAWPARSIIEPQHQKDIAMAWLILFIAGILETGWATGLKYTDGFTRLWPSVLTIAAMAVSMYLLAVAARTLPIGTAYAVWVGIGAAGTAVLGVVLFKEALTLPRLGFLALMIVSIVGLKLTSAPPSPAKPAGADTAAPLPAPATEAHASHAGDPPVDDAAAG